MVKKSIDESLYRPYIRSTETCRGHVPMNFDLEVVKNEAQAMLEVEREHIKMLGGVIGDVQFSEAPEIHQYAVQDMYKAMIAATAYKYIAACGSLEAIMTYLMHSDFYTKPAFFSAICERHAEMVNNAVDEEG